MRTLSYFQNVPPPPPSLCDFRNGKELIAGQGVSTVVAVFDFETYSEAGHVFNSNTQKWESPPFASKTGLFLVGIAAYSEHPSTEVLSLAYDLKDGAGVQLWKPDQSLPQQLFDYLNSGGLLEAWNVSFERWIWKNVCEKKYNFPPLPFDQLRDAMAKSRAFSLPGSLDAAGNVLDIKNKKLLDGRRLIAKFCTPRSPTKLDARLRILPTLDDPDTQKLYEYNKVDCLAESEISTLVPDLTDFELAFWQCDQKINVRGVQLDKKSILKSTCIIESIYKKYTHELRYITENKVDSINEILKLSNWMYSRGVSIQDLTKESVSALLLDKKIPSDVRRVLELRELIGSASVKKLYTMMHSMTKAERVHDLFIYHSARTGRAAGAGVQPQNMPNNEGTIVKLCPCGRHYNTKYPCPWCGNPDFKIVKWCPDAVKDALEIINTGDASTLEYFFDDPIETIAGCLRGMFIAKSGYDLICSDYSAIEAVVLAMLSGEEWRIEVFKTHGKIYEASAAKISGMPLEELLMYRATGGEHHPLRKLGKVAELASGYQGWTYAWKSFGAGEFLSDSEIENAVSAWRAASPEICKFWGGQIRNKRPELYGVEGAVIKALLQPRVEQECRGIKFIYKRDILYCTLLSGRNIVYHRPRLEPSTRTVNGYKIVYEGWNSNAAKGKIGWIKIETYGGKLVENIVQATARDILAHAIVKLEKNGYPVVLHVHDEIVAEVPKGLGSVIEFEKIMNALPDWCRGWPIKAEGGWRSHRYGK